MVKPEWGTKRSCPKCGERFYDLGNEDPVTCIECGNEWTPEPVLKSKQPIPFDEQDDKKKKDDEKDSDLADDDLDDIDEDDDSPDNDVDLGGDDDLGVDTADASDGKEDDN
ncbi:TIGR02300 family protein [Aurantiacibacter sp. D1-12]|uniref:TIGR02300 family protein n=1 Tax=Aurantiacibacter sp. D1-12 TaxID=2993658 RepID=UPI00237D31A7|nr:TIGR02300 family protein [Aurantiacibacter sp. D1-12]MDE1468361.1 TIGR02300 family protein [Aurantiacibacter sp. D1-12]